MSYEVLFCIAQRLRRLGSNQKRAMDGSYEWYEKLEAFQNDGVDENRKCETGNQSHQQ